MLLVTHCPPPVVLTQLWPVWQPPHIAPALPQVPMPWPENGTHVEPLQQPFVQVFVLQTQLPFVHVVPVPQVTHDCPLMPQVCMPDGWQLLEVSTQKLPVQAQAP